MAIADYFKQPTRGPVASCACACCVDLRDRIKHDRVILYGCWCSEYEEHERCDCAFCAAPKSEAA